MPNDKTLLVNHKKTDDMMCRPGNTSVAIAAYVTSYARIKLYNLLDEIEQVPGRILYMDTDSVIFSHEDGEPKPSTGDYLGDLTDEIAKDYGPGARCTKFCSLGPKVYALEIWPEGADQPVVPIKIKGITLTDTVLDIVNFEKMLDLAIEYVDKEGRSNECSNVSVPQMQIRATKLQTIETSIFNKTLRAVSEKRRVCRDNNTLPFGYC